MKEVSLHRFAGPYNSIPNKWYVQSPIGLVPKAGGKTRLIFHLSFDFAQYKSINHYTPSELCSVKYQDLDHAVCNCLKLLQEHPDTKIWIGKTDILSVFRILPTLPSMWCYFILKAENPRTGTVVFFIDKCLPFGSRISCVLFQRFSNALVHILAYIVDMKNRLSVTNYLDDFLFLARTLYLCNKLIQQFLFLCMHLGVPIADEKTFWAALQQVFLGILLDGERYVLAVPEEKRQATLNLLQRFEQKKKATVHELQSLAGLLNFLNKAIHPGRAFTRRMYAKFTNIVDFPSEKGYRVSAHQVHEKKKALKPYHHVNLDKEFREDCKVWQMFLQEGCWSVCRPFLDLEKFTNAQDLFFFTDSSANKNLGFGAIYNRKWLFGKWDADFISREEPSIAYLELYSVCAAVHVWQEDLKNLCCVLFCDNQSVVQMLNNTTSSCKNCMILIRWIVLLGLRINTPFFAKYVLTKANFLADSGEQIKNKYLFEGL